MRAGMLVATAIRGSVPHYTITGTVTSEVLPVTTLMTAVRKNAAVRQSNAAEDIVPSDRRGQEPSSMAELEPNTGGVPALSVWLHGSLGFVLGAVTGAAAGLIGVGGGEFRIPILLHVLRLPVKVAAGTNTVIGLFVVTLSLARRWGQMRWTGDDLTLGVVMAFASVLGATLGARRAHKFAAPILKRVVCVYLLAVGLWMVFESVTHAEHVLLEPRGLARWALAALTGFLVAAASGVLGVAGGEMRIPALMYLFARPVQEAGTISLLASIPTVAAGAVTYRRLGHIPNRVFTVAMLMGAGSILGVLVGASLLPFVDKHTLKGLLGVILLLATACLTLPGLFKAEPGGIGFEP